MTNKNIKKEFGQFLKENNIGKPFGDENFMDVYGSCGFIEDWWLSKHTETLEQILAWLGEQKTQNCTAQEVYGNSALSSVEQHIKKLIETK